MAVSVRPPATNRLESLSDEQLIARFRRGEDGALDVALRRHEQRLLRYARRILGDRSPNAEDVVQEAMLRTSLLLRRGDRAIDLRPWLFKLVRNCALDELARVRAETTALDADTEPAAADADPAHVAHVRRQVRDTLADVAALPDLQRHALVRRELDGAPHAEVAEELGISEPASRVLVLRARANLVKARAGRDARCDDVRDALLLADDARRRASAHVYRHLATCAPCRRFRAELRRRRAAMQALLPLPGVVLGLAGLKALLGGLALPGGSSGAKLATAGAVTAAIAGGALGLERVFVAGDAAPVGVRSAAMPGGVVEAGTPLPRGTAIVTERVAGTASVGRHELRCPDGLRVAGLSPTTSRTTHALAPDTIVGFSRTAAILVEPAARGTRLTLAIVCKRPDRDGSVLAESALARAAAVRRAAALCVDRAYLRTAPDGRVVGSLTRAQPLVVTDRRTGWRRVTADSGDRGWVPARTLC